MNTVSKAAFTAAASTLLFVDQAHAAINFGQSNVDQDLAGSQNSAEVTIQNLISNFMVFLGIIAVCYGLWGGFKILTAGGNDDGVSSGKKILVQAGIGLVVIFLANSLVKFVLGALFVNA
ncbi:MAG TPA: hypothetical protein PK765_01415 [bacterium]|nr:hypothetical protein [bacterium]